MWQFFRMFHYKASEKILTTKLSKKKFCLVQDDRFNHGVKDLYQDLRTRELRRIMELAKLTSKRKTENNLTQLCCITTLPACEMEEKAERNLQMCQSLNNGVKSIIHMTAAANRSSWH
ncbi:uncharacterized protein [Phyllobates terribilis]|uniref:uncharacterized protein isoform X2 n=1 Tax=Phyllobates terribilis TaxID=111132 RepID=UPI003CCAFA4E